MPQVLDPGVYTLEDMRQYPWFLPQTCKTLSKGSPCPCRRRVDRGTYTVEKMRQSRWFQTPKT